MDAHRRKSGLAGPASGGNAACWLKAEILGVVSPENIEVVRAFADAYNAGDVARMEALCTEDPEIAGIRAALEQTSYAGSDAVRGFWLDATEIWSERRLEIEEIDARGDDAVIVRAIWHGRGRGSGVDVERQIGFRFRLEAGRIASMRTFVSPDDAG
jgi:ketosteroid isomerase-like protein